MTAQPYVLYYAALAAGGAALAAFSWRRRYYRSGRPLALLFAVIAFWAAARAMAIADSSFSGTLFWSLVQFGGISLIMPAWLMLALSYTGHWWRHRRAALALIVSPAPAFVALALTNQLHGLWWSQVAPDTSRGYMWLSTTPGPLFWLHALYAYACFALGTALLAGAALRAEAGERRHAWVMLAAALLPALGNLAHLAGFAAPGDSDPTLTLLALGALASLYATQHFRVIDLAPIIEREALAALPDGVAVLDNQGRLVEANPEAARLLGLPAGPLLGRKLGGLIAGSPIAGDLRALGVATAQPRTHQIHYEQAGAQHALEVRIRPLLAANGALAGTLLLVRDVSERARAERAQARHLAELSLVNRVARAANSAVEPDRLIDTVASAILRTGVWERVVVGLVSPETGQLRVAADQQGPEPQGQAADRLLALADLPEVAALLRERRPRQLSLAGPEPAAGPLAALMASHGLESLTVVTLFHHGAPLGLLALGNTAATEGDRATLHLAETIGELITDALVRARLYAEAQEADRLKSVFLASISHELRTPLTAITTYVELLQRGIYGQPGEAMREALANMRISSDALLRQISDILDFTRMEAGHLRIDLQPTDVRRVIYNVVGQLQPQISERGLGLELEIAPGLPRAVANPGRLEQVLSNLLSNAVKFTERGQITIATRAEAGQLAVSVCDTGVGIAPEHLPLIFQEFRRIEGARRTGGAGLGLAICRRLIDLMGGSLSVVSAPGQGSTFTISLPMVEEQLTEPAQARSVGGGPA